MDKNALFTLKVLFLRIMYFIFSKTMHLLFAKTPNNFKPEAIIVNRFEPISQFILFGLVIYLGFNPPALLVDLINETIHLLN